jgi:hypothetical protein
MATPRRPRRNEARLAFEALSIRGGLLSPDWLARITQLGAGQQAPADYRVPKGLQLRDEIGRYWRIALAYWAELVAGRGAKGDPRALAERFVLALLRECFGFQSLAPVAPVAPITLTERSFPIGFAALGARVPVVIAPLGVLLDAPLAELGDDHRRCSAFGLVQEYLDAADDAQWGIACNGAALRIARDNASLTRPAWIEADLERMFTEERYADFTALWLLAHETRFGAPGQSALETWRKAGLEEGTRIRGQLEPAFEDALRTLGQGFLYHPDNQHIRSALETGGLTRHDYFQQLLRLVYRLIFLLTVEERELLHPRETADAAKRLYADGYSMKRLRERCLRRTAHDRYGDLWEAVKIVFRGLGSGEPRLGLPALAGLFAASQCPALDAARLENRWLLQAVFRLAWLREPTGLIRVNWRDKGPEELGSVYETLLELDLQIKSGGRELVLVSAIKGNARKTSGSYYTPDSLVKVLLVSALDPVIAETIAQHPRDPVEALLRLSIVDPACGSGHFLLGAAHRLATQVAQLQVGGTPTPDDHQHALRQVVGRCIFGVDLNPMAVELCKVSLWMEAVEPGLPLTFLDSHIQQGNALLGATPELMAQGIPDAAWEPIEGDDKKTASELKKRNKAERTDLNVSFEFSPIAEGGTVAIASQVQALDAAADAEVTDVAFKEATWQALLASQQYRARRLAADAWCAAFVWRKPAKGERHDNLTSLAPTHQSWERLRHDPQSAPHALVAEVQAIAERYKFFHWYLAFPQVFAKGGFDVVLGNPPWEHVEIKEEEWFAERMPEIAKAVNAAARKKMISALKATLPTLHAEFAADLRAVDAANHLARESGRFPMTAKGRINTYALFAELDRALLSPRGRAGFIVPPGLATDDTTKAFFQDLIVKNALVMLYEFENEEFLFPAIDHRVRFILLTVSRERASSAFAADLSFANRSVEALADPERHFSLSQQDFKLLNPNTRTCPTFRSKRDAIINMALYRRAGVLWREDDPDGNPWGLRFMQGIFNMASDSELFRTQPELNAAGWQLDGNQYVLDKKRLLPLVEAKMVRHFDHRFGTYEGQSEAQANQGKLPEFDDTAHADPHKLTLPRYWVSSSEVDTRLEGRWDLEWLLGWRDICRSTDQRTVIASLIRRSGTGDTFLLAMPSAAPRLAACLYGCLCSFALDYAARQKVGGTHLKYHTFKQLPVLAPSTYAVPSLWSPKTTYRDWLLRRVLELTYTAWDLEPFARDVGYEGPPFRWEPERRFALRAELDAAFFHLYGISRSDADYILDTFPVVKKNDEKAHGDYRTKRAILEVYDALDGAARSGTAYRSPLYHNGEGGP